MRFSVFVSHDLPPSHCVSIDAVDSLIHFVGSWIPWRITSWRNGLTFIYHGFDPICSVEGTQLTRPAIGAILKRTSPLNLKEITTIVITNEAIVKSFRYYGFSTACTSYGLNNGTHYVIICEFKDYKMMRYQLLQSPLSKQIWWQTTRGGDEALPILLNLPHVTHSMGARAKFKLQFDVLHLQEVRIHLAGGWFRVSKL